MSRSIHVTKKNFKGLSKNELDEQAKDVSSDLVKWIKKIKIKKEKKANRKTK